MLLVKIYLPAVEKVQAPLLAFRLGGAHAKFSLGAFPVESTPKALRKFLESLDSVLNNKEAL